METLEWKPKLGVVVGGGGQSSGSKYAWAPGRRQGQACPGKFQFVCRPEHSLWRGGAGVPRKEGRTAYEQNIFLIIL